jgi:hypothetical protein
MVECSMLVPVFGASVVSRDCCSLFISLHGAGVASRGCCELMSKQILQGPDRLPPFEMDTRSTYHILFRNCSR